MTVVQLFEDVKEYSLLDLVQIISDLNNERQVRGKLFEIQEKFPLLFVYYLVLDESKRELLEIFRKRNPDYFYGQYSSDVIRFFNHPQNSVGRHVRRVRYTYQMLECIEENLKGPKIEFNRAFIDQYKGSSWHRCLASSIQKNLGDVGEIVNIVASARPEILEYYVTPERKKGLREAIRFRRN